MNIYEIRSKLEANKKAVFSTADIARLLGMERRAASVYINRMAKKGLLFPVEKGKVSLTNDPFVMASQISFPSYISFVSALYLYNIVQQVIDKIYLVTTRKSRRIYVSGVESIFIKVDPKMMFGYKKVEKEKSFIMLAELEKAVIDCLLFPRYCRLIYVLAAIRKSNIKKLEEYAMRLNKEVLIRRLGYMLDLLKRKHSLRRKTNTSYKLNPSTKKKGSFNSKWYLYINEVLNADEK